MHVERLGSLKSFALIGAFAVFTTLAHASTITYDLTGLTTSAGALNGTIGIDSTTDTITSADITFNDTGIGLFTFTGISSSAAYNGLGQAWITGSDPTPGSAAQIALFYDTANIGTGNLTLCLESGPYCGTTPSNGVKESELSIYWPSGFNADITGGALDVESAVGAAPEPSSLALLGTGLLALAAFTARFGLRKG